MRKNKRSNQIKDLTRLAMLIALEAIVCFVPFLGSIQIGPVVATLAMIPVIIAGMTYGIKFGGILGFFAGLFSFIWWTLIDSGNPSSILFTPWNAYTDNYRSYWPIIICFVPRILTGIVAGLISNGLKSIKDNKVTLILFGSYFTEVTNKNLKRKDIFIYFISGIIGSLTNTFLVLFGTYFLWGQKYAEVAGMDYKILLSVILGIVGTNGLFEALVGGIIGSITSYTLSNIKK